MSDLKVVLTLVDDFSKRLTGVETGVKQFGREIEGVSSTITKVAGAFAGLFAVDKIKDFVQAGVEYGATVTDMANRTGLGVESVQKLDYVAKMSGSSVENLQKALKDMAVKAYDNNKAFKVLGISVKDQNGGMREVGDIFKDTLLKLSEIPNTTERAAIANKLFGKGMNEVMGIAGKGKEEIQGLYEEVDKYGLLLSKETIRRLHDAEEAQTRLKKATQVLGAEFSVTFTPAIIAGTTALAAFFKTLHGDDRDDVKKSITEGELAANKNEIIAIDSAIKNASNGYAVWSDKTGALRRERIAIAQAEADAIKSQIKMNESAISKIDNKESENNKSLYSSSDFKDPKKDKEEIERQSRYKAEQDDYMKHITKMHKIRYKENQDYLKSIATSADLDAQIEVNKTKLLTEQAEGRVRISIWEADQDKKIKESMWTASYKTTNALVQLGKFAVNQSKMQAQEKKNILTGIAIAEGAASIVTAVKAGWDTGVTFYDKAALAIAGGVVAAAETATNIATIQSTQFALGTYNAPGGMSLVGERGPEMINLPRGSQVINNSTTKSMTSGHTFNVTINGSKSTAENLYQELRSGDRGVQKLVDYLVTAGR